MIINSPGCSPVVTLSKSYNPVANPVISFLFSAKNSKFASVFCNTSLIDLNSVDFLFFTISKIFFSELSKISLTVSSVEYPSLAISSAVVINLLNIDDSCTMLM